MHRPRYVYADFTNSCINYGNWIIEYATRNMIRSVLPPAAVEFDSFTTQPPVRDDIDFMVIPGCTMLTPGQNPGLNEIDQLPYPSYCLSGSVWTEYGYPGFLVRNRVIGSRASTLPDLSIVRQLTGPVGARDSYTHAVLTAAGIESEYVGCPTLFLPKGPEVGNDGYVLFSFGRRNVRKQTRAGLRIARNHPVIGICHEKGDYERYRAAGWNLPLVTWEDNVELYLSYFKRASVVVTGRLHGALPSLAYEKKVFYFGTRDTRTSILDDLGVRIHDYSDLTRAVELASASYNKVLVDTFRTRWEMHMNRLFHTADRMSGKAAQTLYC